MTNAPGWAHSVGTDEYGKWADIRVGEVMQRMRWIEQEVSLGFWMFDTLVTPTIWIAVMGSDKSYPIDKIMWDDTVQFLKKINELTSNLNLTLPTESQWEYAALANVNHEKQLQLTLSLCNAWGLYDMLGNVWEWCSDYIPNSFDGNGVLRGGSHDISARLIRLVHYDGYYRYGFRCVKNI